MASLPGASPPVHPAPSDSRPRPDRCGLILRLNSDRYTLRPVPLEGLDAFSVLRAYRLRKLAATPGGPPAAVYEVAETLDGPRCDCPDFTWNRKGKGRGVPPCKHIRALRVLGLLGRGGGR